MGQIHKPSYRVTPNLATAETPFFWSMKETPNLPLHQLLNLMQQFLGDPESWLLILEAHHLVLAIAKKTLDENHFRAAQKTTDSEPPSFTILSVMEITYISKIRLLEKTRSCNVKDVVLKPPVELSNINMQFGRAGRYINHPANLPTITLTDWRRKNKTLLMYHSSIQLGRTENQYCSSPY